MLRVMTLPQRFLKLDILWMLASYLDLLKNPHSVLLRLVSTTKQ